MPELQALCPLRLGARGHRGGWRLDGPAHARPAPLRSPPPAEPVVVGQSRRGVARRQERAAEAQRPGPVRKTSPGSMRRLRAGRSRIPRPGKLRGSDGFPLWDAVSPEPAPRKTGKWRALSPSDGPTRGGFESRPRDSPGISAPRCSQARCHRNDARRIRTRAHARGVAPFQLGRGCLRTCAEAARRAHP